MPDPKTPENANPTAPGDDSGKKKIAGKFDTLEQAVEEGYVGLEKGFHSLSENVSKLTKIMEAALSAPTAPIGHNPIADDSYRRGPAPEDDDIDPAQFLVNPREVLQRRDEKLANKIISTVVDLVGNMNAVNQFKADNSDLAKHEKIVKAFMSDTDKRLPVTERLQQAGNAAREYLKSLKVDLNAGNPNSAPHSNDYVEPPSRGGPRAPAPAPLDDEEGEKALLDYISERNKGMADHFRPPK